MKVYKSKYSKEDIELLLPHYTHKEIGEILGTTGQYISRLVSSYDLKGKIKPCDRNNNIKITTEMQNILVGSVLGDGNITKSKGYNCYFRFEHGYKQYDYIMWKYNKLNSLCKCKGPKSYTHYDNRYNKTYYSYYFNTITHSYFTELHSKFYDNKGNKIIPKRDFGNLITPQALAVWFMDDGTAKNNYYTSELCVQGFSDLDIKFIKMILNIKYDLDCKIIERRCNKLQKSTKNLIFNAKSCRKLNLLIQDYVIDSMQYKIYLK